MNSFRPPTNPALVFILACYFALGIVYAATNPTFEAADELNHYLYVKQISDGTGLPVQSIRGDNPALQEASQPPLYYLIAAAATFWIDTQPLQQTYQRNPHAAMGRPAANDNKNMVVHGNEESLPWRGTVLAVRVIRFLSLLMGGLTILITYGIARELLPRRQGVALAAAALGAFIPSFLFISGAVNNDNMVTMLSSLALLLTLRHLRRAESWSNPALIGAVCGLGAISKVSGLIAVLLAVLAVGWTAAQKSKVEIVLRNCSSLLAMAVVVAGWWYARNWLLYTDPLGLATMVDVAGARPAGFGLLDLLPEQEGLRWSFWAVFGGFNVVADRWVYWVYDLLSLAAVIGIGWALVKQVAGKTKPAWASDLWPRWALASLWLSMFLAALARWSLSTMGSQGRLLYPALSIVLISICFGLDGLTPSRTIKRPVAVAAFGVLGLLAAYMPFAYITPAYRQPPLAPAAQPSAVPNPLMATIGEKIVLEGYEIDRRAALPGGDLIFTLYWRVLSPPAKDLSVFVHVYGADGSTIGQVDSYPGGGAYATSRLPSAVALKDRYRLRLSPNAPPGQASIAAGLYDFRTMRTEPARDAAGNDIGGSINLGSLRVVPPARTTANATKVGINLDNLIVVEGFDIASRSARPGDTVEGNIYWRALAQPAESYTAFVHLIGSQGLTAQQDAPPLQGEYPTSDWRPGDLVADHFVLRVPRTAPGDYSLLAGMYRNPAGKRLAVQRDSLTRLWNRVFAREKAAAENDAVSLGSIRIE